MRAEAVRAVREVLVAARTEFMVVYRLADRGLREAESGLVWSQRRGSGL